MGARPSSFKRGGGFLHNVDGTITEVIFTTDRPVPKSGTPRTVSDFTSLFVRLTIQEDGKEGPTEQSLFAGNGSEWRISRDGRTITALEDGAQLWGGTDWSTFLDSAIEAGFPVTELPEDDEPITYQALVGRRYRFHQVVNPEKTAKLGKRRDPKTGKEYDRRDLCVLTYYGTGTTTSGATKGGKPNGEATGDADVAALATTTLTNILKAAKNHTIRYADLKLKVTMALMGNPLRNEVRAFLEDEENLGALEGIAYDRESKGREIALIPF
jgi:hypothetical protein